MSLRINNNLEWREKEKKRHIAFHFKVSCTGHVGS